MVPGLCLSPRYSQILAVAAIFSSLHFAFAASDNNSVEWARENINAGKYTEALQLLDKLIPTKTSGSPEWREANLVLIEACRIVGKLKEAQDASAALLKSAPKDSELKSLNAELDFETGNYAKAREAYDSLIAENPNNERAWALRTFVLRAQGDRETLKKTTDHFFDLYEKKKEYFNSSDVKDPRELAYIATGIQEENPKDAFETGFMIAEDLVRTRGVAIPEIFLWSAHLAHEKYSFANADTRYKELLGMRPNLPDALSGRAAIVLQSTHNLDDVEKILKATFAVNPTHIDSNLIQAQIDLEEDRFADAKKHIETALSVNPNHLHALAMLAFYSIFMNEPEKMAEAEKRVLAINPKCADFYCDIGELMEEKLSFNTAPAWYKKGLDVDPDNWRGYFGLGMNTSREGAFAEESGKAMLLKAFEKNKFNLWALNMIKVLDRIIGDKDQDVPPVYSESKTPHFTLKYFNKEAAIVAPYLEEWAEHAYARQAKLFGFEPQGPLSIELCFSFQDQAARTVGLPNLGALGVCFGKLCTVVSPREGKGTNPPFNWRRVIEHEFGHVMALQMSEFRVPRWYTEAFSTYLEDDSRIQSDRMMIDAIAKDQLKPIDKMNEYFRINPLMAYVHGRYVIEYIAKNFGFEAHIKALKLFKEGKKLPEVLPAVTGKTLAELDAGQLDFLKKSFATVKLRPSYDPASLVKLEVQAKEENASAQTIADFGIAQLAQRRTEAAEQLAKRALDKDSKCVDALNLLGNIAYTKKDFEGAKKYFVESTGIDAKRSFTAWHLLGVIYKKEGKTTKAIEAFEAARAAYPRYIGPDNPHHELPELYADLEPAQLDKALGVWRDAVKINSEDAEAALNGLKLAVKMKDPKAAIEFAEAHIEIDPYNAEVHRLAGKSYEELKDLPHAAREYAVGTAVDEKDLDAWVGLARIRKAMGQQDEALKAALQALDIDGGNAEAKAIRDSIQK